MTGERPGADEHIRTGRERSTSARRLNVFVTVGMGPWPFDRLLDAVRPLTAGHDVFVQRGASTVALDAPSAAFLSWAQTQHRLRAADVVVTHGGNTVRLVQRMGKVPIAVAREAVRAEMRNDHQVEYLAAERRLGRVVVLAGDLRELTDAVHGHPETESAMLAVAPPMPRLDEVALTRLLDRQVGALVGARTGAVSPVTNPFLRHPTRRYRWAFDQLVHRDGHHLDLGVGDGEFTQALQRHTDLRVIAADAHEGYLRRLTAVPGAPTAIRMGGRIPLASATLSSVSMLDSLEHVADEDLMLAEVQRVLARGGLLVLTVPARHVFSFLDPDDAKLRHPRIHAAVYRTRFGAARYAERFLDPSDGLRGDLAWSRSQHTNYRPAVLLEQIRSAGFVPQVRDGANLFWRLLQVPQLLLPGRAAGLVDAPLRWDGSRFHQANLFLTAVRA